MWFNRAESQNKTRLRKRLDLGRKNPSSTKLQVPWAPAQAGKYPILCLCQLSLGQPESCQRTYVDKNLWQDNSLLANTFKSGWESLLKLQFLGTILRGFKREAARASLAAPQSVCTKFYQINFVYKTATYPTDYFLQKPLPYIQFFLPRKLEK